MVIDVLLCYADKDTQLLNELKDHFTSLRREGRIVLWDDSYIGPGKDWEQEIDDHLNTAHIILLFISSAFLASEYCHGEMQRALERHKRGEARVIPVILRPTDWENTSAGTLQALPTGGKAITKWSDRDDAYLDVTNGLREAIDEVRAQNSASQPQRTSEDVADYLVIAANKMDYFLSGGSLGKDDFVSAASVGCATLHLLAEDQEFKGYVEALTQRQWDERNNFHVITHGGDEEEPLAHFLSFFRTGKRGINCRWFSSPIS